MELDRSTPQRVHVAQSLQTRGVDGCGNVEALHSSPSPIQIGTYRNKGASWRWRGEGFKLNIDSGALVPLRLGSVCPCGEKSGTGTSSRMGERRCWRTFWPGAPVAHPFVFSPLFGAGASHTILVFPARGSDKRGSVARARSASPVCSGLPLQSSERPLQSYACQETKTGSGANTRHSTSIRSSRHERLVGSFATARP